MRKCRPRPASHRNSGHSYVRQFDERILVWQQLEVILSLHGSPKRSESSAAFDAAGMIVVETPRPDAVRQASRCSGLSLSDYVFGRYGVQSGLPLQPESEHAAGVRS
jgi:hypothetical protein